MNTPTQKSLAFFPWMQIDSEMKIGSYLLFPFKRGEKPFGNGTDEQRHVDNILGFYKINKDQPVREAILLKMDGVEWFTDYTDEQMGSLFSFSELLAFSTLSEREYFVHGGGKPNRDCSRLFVQRFIDSSKPPSVTTRKRDGTVNMGFASDSFEEICPRHVSSDVVKINVPVIEALQKCIETENGRLMDEAIFSFNNANTDSSQITEAAEVVMTVGAFEMLFDVRTGKADDLVDRFNRVFKPEFQVDTDKVARLVEQGSIPGGSLAEIWLRDFVVMRHQYAHGKRTPRHNPKWSTREHLLLSSFLFPLLVKLILNNSGLYELSDTDQTHYASFEKLLAEDLFAHSGASHDSQDWPWNRVLSDARWECQFRKVSKDFADKNEEEENSRD